MMYILREVDFIVRNGPTGDYVEYKLTYEVDEFGFKQNRVVYVVTADAGSTIETKISEKKLKEKYFKTK